MGILSFLDRRRNEFQSLPLYKAEINLDLSSDLEVSCIGLVDKPAIERNFQAFNAHQKRVQFAVNEERQIISGPAMIADMPIYRNDQQLGEYYVVFDKPAIQSIVQKFSAKGYLKNFNLFHDQQQQVSDVTIFNSFVSDKSLGIAPMTGFEDIADGSWFISAKVNNPTVWQDVKSGTIRGFSVEGLFNYIPVKKPEATDQLAAMVNTRPLLAGKIRALMNSTKPGQEEIAMRKVKTILKAEAPDIYRALTPIFED